MADSGTAFKIIAVLVKFHSFSGQFSPHQESRLETNANGSDHRCDLTNPNQLRRAMLPVFRVPHFFVYDVFVKISALCTLFCSPGFLIFVYGSFATSKPNERLLKNRNINHNQ